MGEGGLAFAIVLFFLLTLAFVGFCIYFFFKQLQFVIQAINLYKKILNREDAILKVLIDIRDNTKHFSESTSINSESPVCTCGTMISSSDEFCPECGKKLL